MTMTNEFSMCGDFTFEDLKIIVVVLNDHVDKSIEVSHIERYINKICITYSKVIEVTE